MTDYQAVRAEHRARKSALGAGVAMHRVEELTICGADEQPLRMRVLVPTAQPRGVVVYLHGGGWVLGSIDSSDRLGREIAARTCRTVVMVDYAKAPERPFPAAVDDAWASVRWAIEHRDELAGENTSLAVVGDSAGGNLALVATLMAQQHQLVVDHLVLVYPVVDTAAGLQFDDGDSLDFFLDAYLPNPVDRRDWRAAPIHAANLAELPPVLVQVADRDPLTTQGIEFAATLRELGVEVELHRYPGTRHGFISMFREDPEADRAVSDIATALACSQPEEPSP